jgi:hypothetical protein
LLDVAGYLTRVGMSNEIRHDVGIEQEGHRA